MSTYIIHLFYEMCSSLYLLLFNLKQRTQLVFYQNSEYNFSEVKT
jgi:hypothetical protein